MRRVIGVTILTTLLCASTAPHLRADPPVTKRFWERFSIRQFLPNGEQSSTASPPETTAPPPEGAAPTRSDLLRASSQSTGTSAGSSKDGPGGSAVPSGSNRRGLIRLSLWNKPPPDPEPAASAAPEPVATAALELPPLPGLSRIGLEGVQPAGWETPAADSEPIVPVAHGSVVPLPDDTNEIAKPLFGEVLDNASRPTGIIQSDWEVEDVGDWIEEQDWIDAKAFKPPEWQFWKSDSPRSRFCRRLFGFGPRDPWTDVGIGRERVKFGTFEIDPSQPWNNVRARYDAVYSLQAPDRLLYFWAKHTTGLSDEVVNYQDFRVYSEFGGTSATAIIEYPLRTVDPVFADNTTGFGDMVVGNKAIVVDGRDWQITQVFRTYINTGSVKRGLGTGHVSLEPGVLARYKWTEDTYIHGEFKVWIPIAADMAFSGQVLRYGIGLTHVGYDNDVFAIIHSAEFVGMTFVHGEKTVAGVPVSVDGESVATWMYGMHLVLGPAGDLGLFEVGLAGGVGAGVDWYDGLFRLDFRWNY